MGYTRCQHEDCGVCYKTDKESWRGQCTKALLVHVLVARTASMDRQRGDWTIMPGPHSGIFYYALR